jgi:hypothetical protein
MRVRHKTFTDCTGVAVRSTTKCDRMGYDVYPATEVWWDRPYGIDAIVANYNLVFIVPAVTRPV